MLAVGENKAKLFHGDNHPASLYVGDKLISGFSEENLIGKGQVGWEAPYKAALPAVTVKGAGQQEKLSGKNLIDIITNVPQNAGIKTEIGRIVIPPVSNDKESVKGPYLKFKPNTEYTISGRVLGKFTGRIYALFVFSLYSTAIKNGFFSIKQRSDSSGEFGDKGRFLLFTNNSDDSINYKSNETVTIYDIQIEEGTVATPYEPYCGGIPAPNPEYPIEPVFLEGASVESRGRNLLDFSNVPLAEVDGNLITLSRLDASVTKKTIDCPIPSHMSYDIKSNKGTNARLRFRFKDGSYSAMYKESTGDFVHFEYSITKPTDFVGIDYSTLEGGAVIRNCIISPGSTPTPYTPYIDLGTAPLPILRALPDGSVRDEYDVRTGKLTRRIGHYVDGGTFKNRHWSSFTGGGLNQFYADFPVKHDINKADVISTNFRGIAIYDRYVSGYNTIFTAARPQICFNVAPDFVPIGSTKDWINYIDSLYKTGNPIEFYYVLPEPVIEQYDPTILRQHPGYTQLIQQGGAMPADINATVYKEN